MKSLKQQTIKNIPVTSKLRNVNGKTFVAIVLVSVMALLWGRVLLKGRSGPADAGAAEMNTPTALAQTPVTKPVNVVPVELPFIEGRHDTLISDIFSAAQWKALNAKPEEAKPVVVVGNSLEKQREQIMEKIAAGLKLQGVVCDADGKPLQVYVNDAILTVGSVLTVQEGPEQYELTLMEMNEKEVTFDWNGASISLEMTEMVEK